MLRQPSPRAISHRRLLTHRLQTPPCLIRIDEQAAFVRAHPYRLRARGQFTGIFQTKISERAKSIYREGSREYAGLGLQNHQYPLADNNALRGQVSHQTVSSSGTKLLHSSNVRAWVKKPFCRTVIVGYSTLHQYGCSTKTLL
jgi:hypothetical protein